MSSKPDFIRKKFGPLREKTLRNALAHRIVKEFPRIGGPRICQLCADMILEVISKHMRSQEHVTHGQALWMAVSVNNPPAHRQRIADTDLVPVLLDLCTAEDVQQRIDRRPAPERLLHKVLRLCQQAHEQGGLLSNCDLAELLNTTDSEIAHVLARHERLTNTVVPAVPPSTMLERGLLISGSFVGSATPRARSRTSSRETYHSLEAVDRYLGQYDRVRHCRLEGLTPEQTAPPLVAACPWSGSILRSTICWRKTVADLTWHSPEQRLASSGARMGSQEETEAGAELCQWSGPDRGEGNCPTRVLPATLRSPGRRIGQRGDATRAPTQAPRPGWAAGRHPSAFPGLAYKR